MNQRAVDVPAAMLALEAFNIFVLRLFGVRRVASIALSSKLHERKSERRMISGLP